MKPESRAAAVVSEPMAVLRPLREGDAGTIARWYDKAIMLAGSPVPLSDLLDLTDRWRTLLLVEEDTEEAAGVMAVTLDDLEPDWATVALLVVRRPGTARPGGPGRRRTGDAPSRRGEPYSSRGAARCGPSAVLLAQVGLSSGRIRRRPVDDIGPGRIGGKPCRTYSATSRNTRTRPSSS